MVLISFCKMLFYLLLSACIALLIFYFGKSKKRLPPGPRGLPILGNLLQLDKNAPHESLAQIAWKYGPVCGLRMGSVYTVLLTDPKLIRQAFAKDSFSGRAPLYLTHGIMKGYGLIAAEGERWREQRKFVASAIKNFGMVKFESPRRDNLEERILGAVNEALEKFESRQKEDGVNTHGILHHCLGNLMNHMAFGRTYNEDDELWKWLQHMQEEGVKQVAVSGPINFLPIFRFIPAFANSMKFLLDGQKKTHDEYRKILREHRSNPTEMKSFLAAYDEEMKRRITNNEDLGSFTDTQLMYLLADIHGAGVDTTLATIDWFLLFMAAYPGEQAKIQEEMDNLLGGKDPKLEHRPALIRLEAAIMEVQRVKSVVPTGIPHGTTEDTKIEDYDIPKGTMVIPLQWAVHMNPLYWPEPHVFKPERFIEKDGSLAKPDAFMPFQIGKRMCVGDEFARMVLYLFAARILHRFKLSAPRNRTINLNVHDNGITLMSVPQNLMLTRRL